MARQPIPQVSGGVLALPGGQVEVGSAAWIAWLAAPTSASFGFRGARGSLTARRERQRNGWYWYGYRRQGGRLRKLYIGRAEDITLARLEAVAEELAGAPDPPPAAIPPPEPPGQAALLATKLRAPPLRGQLVGRQRLVERLASGLAHPLTLLVAPAGFGKTTLLASLVAHAARAEPPARIAWLSLDPGDNDPNRLWAYLVAALDSACPGVVDAVRAAPDVPQSTLADALPPLLNAVAAAPADIVLALDDYHAIELPAIHQALAYALDHMPDRLRLAIATRADPPLPLARLRARGQLTELRAADLRFTADEAGRFLAGSMGLSLPADAVAALEERTEGWAAGLQLAALAVRDRADRAGFIASFAGSHRAVADYLAEEVIDRQPEHVQRFLLHTAVLERMCAALCDVLLPEPQPASSQELIEHLERANLFVVPLDDERRWYRYHHLFAEMLRDRLRRRSPELPAQLHRRAAAWHRAAGHTTEAVDHALAAEDYALAAEIIEQVVASVMWVLNEVHTLMRWLGAFPPAFLRSRPRLLVAQAWALLAQVRLGAVEQIMRQLEAEPEHEAEVRGYIAATRSFLFRIGGDIPAALAAAHHALDDLPEEDLNIRSLVASNLENCYMAMGDVRRAERALASLDVAQVPSHSFHWLNIMLGRHWLHRARGQLQQAHARAEEALRTMQEAGRSELPSTGLVHVAIAELRYEWSDLEGAEQHARRALALGDRWWNSDVLVNAYSVLGLVHLARGEPEAERMFAETERLLRAYDAPSITQAVETGKARAALIAGRLEEGLRWADASGLAPGDSPDPLHGERYAVLARALICRGRADAALPLLERLVLQAEASEYTERAIELHKVRALALDALGRPGAAREAMGRALTLARPGGYVRAFVDEGPPVARLIREALAHEPGVAGPLRDYARRVLAAFSGAPEHPPTASPHDLTARELDVLRLLAAGHGNQRIADELVVAVSTVRSHVKSIYAKLGVGGRVLAVERARALGLLAG